jgi:hypothetical protein
VHFLDLKEEYVITFPSVYANGIIIGSLSMELGDKVSIVCSATGLTAEFEFLRKVRVQDVCACREVDCVAALLRWSHERDQG